MHILRCDKPHGPVPMAVETSGHTLAQVKPRTPCCTRGDYLMAASTRSSSGITSPPSGELPRVLFALPATSTPRHNTTFLDGPLQSRARHGSGHDDDLQQLIVKPLDAHGIATSNGASPTPLTFRSRHSFNYSRHDPRSHRGSSRTPDTTTTCHGDPLRHQRIHHRHLQRISTG
jgi:hypothetical protein